MSETTPDRDTLAKLSTLEVFDVSGTKVNFASFYEDKKVIAVFIRHFFCGTCQQYVALLTSEYEKLVKVMEEANTDIVIIGCGDWQPIEAYSGFTGFPSSKIYADPKLNVFHALGMNNRTYALTPAGQNRPSYIKDNVVTRSIVSTGKALMRPKLWGKQGDTSQNGGEFVLGPGNQCTFAHRMQHTEDHTEIPLLLERAGLSQDFQKD